MLSQFEKILPKSGERYIFNRWKIERADVATPTVKLLDTTSKLFPYYLAECSSKPPG